MGERRFEVETYGVDYICDDCNTGVMEQTGIFHAMIGRWEHKCNHCGAVKEFSEKYPTVRHDRRG